MTGILHGNCLVTQTLILANLMHVETIKHGEQTGEPSAPYFLLEMFFLATYRIQHP